MTAGTNQYYTGESPAQLRVALNEDIPALFTAVGALVGANPTAKVATAAVNGVATTFMRSDAAPPLDIAITVTWSGNHTFSPAAGIALVLNGTAASQIGVFNGTAGNTYFDYKRAGTLIGRVGSADSIVAGGANTDFALSSPAGSLNFAAGGASASRMVIDGATGKVSVVNALGINGAAPPAQITGWGAPTGAAVVANFPGGGPATLAQCSTAIAEIITALKAFGLFGT